MLFRPASESGLPFISTEYSVEPIFAVPEGRIRFCAVTALTTSIGDRLRSCSLRESISTMICRCLPPYGSGADAPGTVASCVFRKLLPKSNSSCSVSEADDSASRRIGTVEAL